MENLIQDCENESTNAWGVLGGLLVGGLLGAGIMLLLAPQSGKKTRAQIQHRSIELCDQTSEAMQDMVARAGIQARKTRSNVRKYSKQLEKQSNNVIEDQKNRLADLVKAGKTAVQESLS